MDVNGGSAGAWARCACMRVFWMVIFRIPNVHQFGSMIGIDLIADAY